MISKQLVWSDENGWSPVSPGDAGFSADLVIVFSSTTLLNDGRGLAEIREAFPDALLFGSSTSGEIADVNVLDESISLTAIKFSSTSLQLGKINIADCIDSHDAGQKLTQTLSHEDLKHVLVLSDGLQVNGSQLVEGMLSELPECVSVTGGLSGDGADFSQTLVIGNADPESGVIAALGLYGDNIRVGCGSLGGWDAFGPERLITRSRDNVLFEMDGKSALELYKKYLGDHAAGLPATGLLFPLCLRSVEGETGLVRTLLSVDEDKQSMTFAGNLPEGAYVQLMRANVDRLIDGAQGAATINFDALDKVPPDLALLISCVGRKMVLKQRVEEEVEAVRETLGEETTLTGFYSYGEISPFSPGQRCKLHNQTMTITTLLEK